MTIVYMMIHILSRAIFRNNYLGLDRIENIMYTKYMTIETTGSYIRPWCIMDNGQRISEHESFGAALHAYTIREHDIEMMALNSGSAKSAI